MYKSTVRNQIKLYPRTIDEIIPKDHLSRFIIEIVNRLDLADIHNKYSDLGQNAYDPRMMLTLLFYSYMNGIFSSRKIEEQCKENINYMFICAEKVPDFRTISDFRKNNLEMFQNYFIQILLTLKNAGLAEFSEVAIDGTKIKANAASRNTKSKEQLQNLIKSAEQQVVEMLQQAAAAASEEEISVDYNRSARQTKARIKKMKKALAALEADPEREKINLTDFDCTLQKGVGAGYNAQLAVDTVTQLALGGTVVTNRNDSAQLLPMIDLVEKNTCTENQEKTILADTGYASAGALAVLATKPHLNAYVPPRSPESNCGRAKGKYNMSHFMFNEETQTYICPNNQPMSYLKHAFKSNGQGYTSYKGVGCPDCPLKTKCTKTSYRSISVYDNEELVAAMRVKTASDAGKRASKRRSQTVEPTFGVLKECKNFRKFHLRGLEKVRGEWMLMLISYNIGKIYAMVQRRNGFYPLNLTVYLFFKVINQLIFVKSAYFRFPCKN